MRSDEEFCPEAELDCYFCWFAMVREDYQRKGVCRALFELTYEKVRDGHRVRTRRRY